MHQAGTGVFFTDALEGETEGEDTVGVRTGYGGRGIGAGVEIGGESVSGGGQAFGSGYGVGLGIGTAGDAEAETGATNFIGRRMAQAAPVSVMKDVVQERFAS